MRKVPRIVAGVDGSPSSREALHWAVRQAGLTGGVVDAVIAWHYPVSVGGFGLAPVMAEDAGFAEIAAKTLAEVVSNVPDAGNVGIRQFVCEGNTVQVLLDAAAGADLLVVGSRGLGGFPGMLVGSVSQNCIHHAPCPVVVIRGDLRP